MCEDINQIDEGVLGALIECMSSEVRRLQARQREKEL